MGTCRILLERRFIKQTQNTNKHRIKNGVATCRKGKYDLDRECRATNNEPLEFLNALKFSTPRDGTFRTKLESIVDDDTNLQDPLFTQASYCAVASGTDRYQDLYIAGPTINTELTEQNVRDAVVQSVQDDITSRIASHQIVSVILSDIDVTSTFESIHSGITTCVEARLKIEFQ